MKTFMKWLTVLGGAAAAVWVARDRLVRIPEPIPDSHPRFRAGEPEAQEATDAPADDGDADADRPSDDLTDLTGVGPAYAQRLASSGITTFAALAKADAEELSELIDVPATQISDWIGQAKQR